MADNKAFYIVTVGGGKCLDNTQTVEGVLDCLPKESDSQKWFIETDDNDPNIVAFKNCADGKYLRNKEPTKVCWARIDTSEEKQWWTLEKGKNPGSCLIRSNACTSAASYLNDFEGVYRDRNLVHMWQMVKERQYWLDWYLMPADASFRPVEAAAPKAEAASSGKDAEQKAADLDAREAALSDKEQGLGKQEAALKKREQNLAKQEAALQQQQSGDEVAPAQVDDNDDGTGQSASQLELLKLENENLKLQLKVQELEEQLKKSQAKPEAGKAPRRITSSHGGANGTSKKEPVTYECGHIAYPPPRKLRRNVVGMLYEGLDQPFELSARQKATMARHR